MNVKTEEVKIIEASDLEQLINQTYGFEPGYYTGYSIAAIEEIGRNSTTYYPYWAGEDNFVDNPLEVTLSTPLHEIMVDLFRKGLLEEGKYLIDVSW
jgi:hypothetical protein